MKFSYREYVSQFPGTSDFRLILRPVITIRIVGPLADARWDALVDTGADESLLPLSLAGLLGVELDANATSQAAGISGDKLTIHYGEVEFQITDGIETIRWQTVVGFVDFGTVDDEVIVLGHGGCLDYFTALFEGEKAELELTANSLLPEQPWTSH
jgi:predicted aspartyl protease